MNTFKQRSLYAAIAGAAALGLTGPAEAVSINPDGLGQVLIYPYYTVRDKVAGASFNTLLSVVNTTNSAKGVKVRFIEGKASKEVLDFNLFLSKYDVWTAAITPHAGGGAAIQTTDKSCTQPAVGGPTAPTPFVNYAYLGDEVEDDTLDRTKEGYVEIIEMGNISSANGTSAVTHVSGVPPKCSYAFAVGDFAAGNGGLFGGITLVNVLAGEDFTTDAVALASFSATQLYTQPEDVLPNLNNVNPATSYVLSGNTITSETWASPIDAVSALFMHDQVMNEFVLDTATKSGTDWVITMPTKSQYYDGEEVQKLFQRNLGKTGACDDINVSVYDREEAFVTSGQSFSPPPPTVKDSLCWESTIITFNNSNVFGSKNKVNLPTNFQNGWVNLTFPVGTSTIYTGSYHRLVGVNTYNGLPVIGFAAQTFNNGQLAAATGGGLVQSQYGGSFTHRTTRAISVTP